MSSNQTKSKKYIPSIIVYNSLLQSSEYKLSAIEFYFYILLSKWKSEYNNGKVLITLNNIYKLQKLYKVDKNNAHTYIKKIRNILISMQSKNVISIDSDVADKNATKNDDLMIIDFLKIDDKYQPIDASVLDVTDHDIKLYILCFIALHIDKKINQSIEGWSTVLGCDTKTAKLYLDELQNENLIYSVVGKKERIGNVYKQSPTTWCLGERTYDEVSEDSSSDQNGTESGLIPNSDSPSSVSPVTSVNYGNWSIHGANLTDDDYDLYAANENDEEFTKVVDKKINIISKNRTNEKVIEMYEKHLQAARERLEAKHREESRVLVDKHRELVISNHQTGQCLTFNNINSTPEQSDMMSVDVEQFAAMNASELKKLNTLYTSFDHNEYTYKVEEQSVPFSYGFSEDSGLIENCSESTVLKIRDEIVKQMNENGKIDVSKLRSYKQELLDECNNGKPMDVEWEGDHYISGENYSLKLRQRMMGNKSKDKNRAEKVTDITRFLDRKENKSEVKSVMVNDGLPF